MLLSVNAGCLFWQGAASAEAELSSLLAEIMTEEWKARTKKMFTADENTGLLK